MLFTVNVWLTECFQWTHTLYCTNISFDLLTRLHLSVRRFFLLPPLSARNIWINELWKHTHSRAQKEYIFRFPSLYRRACILFHLSLMRVCRHTFHIVLYALLSQSLAFFCTYFSRSYIFTYDKASTFVMHYCECEQYMELPIFFPFIGCCSCFSVTSVNFRLCVCYLPN